MPRIINAYADGNSSIADSLRNLGDSMFANQSQKELIRQEALKSARQNTAAAAAAEAYRSNNALELGANDILNNPDSTAMGHQALARAALVPGATPASLAVPQIGAGEGIDSTVPGQNASLGNARTIAGMELAQRQNQFENTPYQTTGPDGQPIVATNKTAIGTAPIPSEERIKALAIAKALQEQNTPTAPAAGPAAPTPAAAPVMPSASSNAPLTALPPVPAPAAAAAPSPAPAAQPQAPAPQTNSFPGLLPNHPGIPHPLVQAALGLPAGGSIFTNPTTGQVGLSYDGGRSVQDASSGHWYVGAGNGFLPSSGEAATGQVQANNQRAAVANPPPPVQVDPNNNQAMSDARASTGIVPFLAHHANEELGATGVVPAILRAWGAGEEIGPGQERARSSQEIRNNEARTALLLNPGRQSTQMQKWVNDLLPEDDALANPATEAAKVPMIVKALQGDLADARNIVGDINTPAAQRTAAVQQISHLQHAIRLFTQPNAPATGAPAAPTQSAAPAAPQQAPITATNPKTGQKLTLINGQWQ